MTGTKKKAKKKKRINKKTAKAAGTKVVLADAITPLYVPPPPVLGQKVIFAKYCYIIYLCIYFTFYNFLNSATYPFSVCLLI